MSSLDYYCTAIPIGEFLIDHFNNDLALSRLKGKDSKTTAAVKFVIKNVDKGGLLLLTGTPVQNNMREIL